MPKFVTIQNLEQYNSKINPRIQDLEQVSDLGYLVNYIKQTQPVTYTVELDGKTYTYKASAEQSESLPKLSDIEDYYGFSQIKEYVETIKNANYLPLTGGNVTGNLTVQDKNVVRSVNGVNADANGNVNVIADYKNTNAGYIQFSNGLIFAWSSSDKPAGTKVQVINKPKPFTTLQAYVTDIAGSHSAPQAYQAWFFTESTNTTDTFRSTLDSSDLMTFFWIGKV